MSSSRGGRSRMSGPSRRMPRAWSSSTGPFHCRASTFEPRRTSHGRPRQLAAARHERPAAVHPQVAAQDVAALEPEQQVLAHRLDREQPAAVEACSAIRPICARGFGVSTSTRSPTSGCRRRAARWSASPSGIGRRIGAVTRGRQQPERRRRSSGRRPSRSTGRSSAATTRTSRSRQGRELAAALAAGRPRAHAANGAVFGARLARRANRRQAGPPVALALAENAALWPLRALVDRYHPARGEPGAAAAPRNRAAFAQACWRHALFGCGSRPCSPAHAAVRRGRAASASSKLPRMSWTFSSHHVAPPPRTRPGRRARPGR